MRLVGLIAACWISTMAAGMASPACAPVPGLAQALSRPYLQFLLLGEVHGTREGPQLFFDVVCNAARSGRPVAVALEDSVDEQGSLDRFMTSRGDAAAREAFLNPEFWGDPLQDGRTSAAYFELHLALRAMLARGAILSVTAVQPGENDNGDYEQTMAAHIQAIGTRHPRALVIALLGNFHAAKARMSFNAGVMPAGSYLHAASVVSLTIADFGGTAWTCASATDCAAHRIGPSTDKSRGAILQALPDGGYDGMISTGMAATASPPALPQR